MFTWKRSVEYENMGIEPRFAGIIIRTTDFIFQEDSYPLNWEKKLELKGAIEKDPEKIALWIESEFLNVKEHK